MENKIVQVNEAISAGNIALNKIDIVLDELKSAKTWGLFDMFSNRSFLSSYIKHSKLDAAQDAMNDLRVAIDKFNHELNDVKIYDEVHQINFDQLTRIFDIFFDNFFVDIYALSRISDSRTEVERLRNEIKKVVEQLERI